MISESVVIAMVRSWRIARTSAPLAALGYATENILSKAGKGDPGHWNPDGELTDAEIVQAIVDQMPVEIKTAFEARELALIRGERCRNLPHHARALTLGIAKSTYWLRVNAALDFIRRRLEWVLEETA